MNNSTLSTDYTNAYVNYGKRLFEEFDGMCIQCILHDLPLEYCGLDIGACDGSFAEQIQQKRILQGKHEGGIICVDPYPTHTRVLAIDGEKYVMSCMEDTFDFVICKFMIHFIQDMELFLKNLKRILRPGGQVYVMTLNPTTSFPWSHSFQTGFVRSCLDTVLFESWLDKEKWNWEKERFESTTKLDNENWQQWFIDLVRSKGFSNLYQYTDAEIEESIQFFMDLCRSKPQDAYIYLDIRMYVLKL